MKRMVALLACLLSAPPSIVDMQIGLAAGPETAQVRLESPPAGNYRTRGAQQAATTHGLRCSDSRIHGDWVGDDCGTLSWQFELALYPPVGAIAADQLSWRDPAGD